MAFDAFERWPSLFFCRSRLDRVSGHLSLHRVWWRALRLPVACAAGFGARPARSYLSTTRWLNLSCGFF